MDTNDEKSQSTALAKAEISLRDIIAQNEFTASKSLLEREIEEADELFGMIKTMVLEEVGTNKAQDDGRPARMGTVNAAPKKRNMMFISSQTTNMISLKNLKMSLINKLTGLQTDQLDRNIRALTQMAKDDKNLNEANNPAAVLDFLMNNLNITIPISPKMREEMQIRDEADDEDDLDRIIEMEEKAKSAPKQLATSFTEAPPEPKRPKKEVTQEALEAEDEPAPTPKKKAKKKKEEPVFTPVYNDEGHLLVYNQDEEKVYVVTDGYDIVRELTSEEYKLDMKDDGTIVDLLTNTIIEIIGEEENG
jgi:hypothetical protein